MPRRTAKPMPPPEIKTKYLKRERCISLPNKPPVKEFIF
jgi:hypothetical protein